MKKVRQGKAKRAERESKALAAANRWAFLGMAASLLLSIPIVLVSISVVPTGSPQAMVQAQMVHVKAAADLHRPASGARSALSATNSLVPNPDTTNSETRPRKERGPAVGNAKYSSIGFDVLSGFRFVVTDQMVDSTKDRTLASFKTLEQIPPAVNALNDKEISLKGFMLPMKLSGSLTTDFLLLRNQGLCCYGLPPKINEWVNVRMAGKGIKPIMDQPVTVCGTFHVGEVRENGALVGIYRLDGKRMGGPGD